MKKISLLIFIITAFLINIFAQSSYIKDRINAKVSFSKYPWMGQNQLLARFTPCFETEVNYGLLNFLEIGAYIGYSQYQLVVFKENTYEISNGYRSLSFYGLNANFHLLPLVIKDYGSRFELYLSSKVGGYYFWNASYEYPKTKNHFDYGIYGGIVVYPGKHWGMFVEYGYGNNTNWRTGLSLKF
jgi:hypothetical protein